MLNADMRLYNYFTYGALNDYGQPTLSKEPVGKVKLAIYPTSQNVQANINYSNANYVGITKDFSISDSFVIEYGQERLKVLYTTKQGRFNQVFLAKVN